MSFANELERTTRDLAALCRRSFGPCGEETLLFCPPEAPIVTGEGHAVLEAWKRGLSADEPLVKFLLSAANGVHQQLGDGSSEFILLVDAAVRHVALNREQDADRARLARAFGELKWELQREMQSLQSCLRLATPFEVDIQTMQPSKQFRETSVHIMKSALHGVLGEKVVEFLVDLVLKWVFSPYQHVDVAKKVDNLLYRRVQQYLKCAPDTIIFMAAPSVYASYVVPHNEFILNKSVVASQPLGVLDRCQESVQFVCFTCSLSLSDGSNHVELTTTTDDELFTAQDAIHLFISKYVRHLRENLQVQLVVSTEALDESVIATCTRQGIACVQLAEPGDVEALCSSAGIFPIASIFDEILTIGNIGVCANGVSRVRFQQQECLRLRGISNRGTCSQCDDQRTHQAVVSQVLIHSPTKGVYKQYYAAIVKSLRVLRCWWEPVSSEVDAFEHDKQPVLASSCRGGGATEVAVAQWLLDGCGKLSNDPRARDLIMFCLARETLAHALFDVVSILQNNLNQTGMSRTDDGSGNQRHVRFDAFSKLKLKGRQQEEYYGYVLDNSRILETLAGPIQIPELVMGDPATYGLVHPWRRIDTLIFLTLQTLEQLFRIDQVFPTTIHDIKTK
ncbi:hypothetical protein PHMEG_00025573 [Phytophthora megakarya]|uniref:Uncharacterized protein n=1 Tax=Phytophthora megakarya TaxID=4795 RepID=A0A225VDD5_9STRA|nr:hypothetical protein PHMEG_00025573 [Phytophthora megakarya]